MKKIIFGITIVLLAAFFLAPRPLLKPDWRSEYNAAIASGDCERIDRIVSLLNIVGLEGEFYFALIDLHDQKLCEFADLDQDFIDNLRQLNTLGSRKRGELPVSAALDSSRARYFYRLLDWDFYGTSAFVRRIERSLFDTLYADCYGRVPPAFVAGLPDYSLLSYALKNPDQSADDVLRLNRARVATCAENLIARSEQLLLAATSPEELSSLPIYAWIAYNLSYAAPELALRLEKLVNQIPDSAFDATKLFRKDTQDGPGWRRNVDGYSCERRFADRTMDGSMLCAATADEAAGQEGAQAYAYYFSLRAKRLGWRDVGVIEARAADALSQECREAIIALESNEAEGEEDPAFYRSQPLPIQKGDICGPELSPTD